MIFKPGFLSKPADESSSHVSEIQSDTPGKAQLPQKILQLVAWLKLSLILS